jgi:hypothetical protein
MDVSTAKTEETCAFCSKFWIDGDQIPWEIPMNGFDRDMAETEESAAAGCHCCAILLSCTDLLEACREIYTSLGDNTNRIFVVVNEDMLALCFLHSHFVNTPLRFVLKEEKGKKVNGAILDSGLTDYYI